jgi:hypothetical protein
VCISRFYCTGKTGTEGFKQLAADVGQAPGTGNVIDFLIAEGDLVVAFMTITRTLLPPTGRRSPETPR